MNPELEAIKNQVAELITPYLASKQVELVELICHSHGGRILLRFLVDTPRGIRVEELSSLNQGIGALLEEREVIPTAYLLEVSSPGLDRPLKSVSDFERVIGRRIKVSTHVPVMEKREHAGELLNANEDAIVLKSDRGEKVRITLGEISHAVQDIEI
ncbi:MAG: ribosome maturation factor RimP [Candidatus Omnitrophica bacterium]|nr:ribosome maturation factor RimP [Candidatus Omnitrophota bacterium]